MEKAYWLRRKSASLTAAQSAVGPEARLAHYDLAGRYSVKAPFVVPSSPLVDGAVPAELAGNGPENTHV